MSGMTYAEWLLPVGGDDDDGCEDCLWDTDGNHPCSKHAVPFDCTIALEDIAEAYGLSEDARREFADAAAWGAGWAFAIVGMAQAIRDADHWRRHLRPVVPTAEQVLAGISRDPARR